MFNNTNNKSETAFVRIFQRKFRLRTGANKTREIQVVKTLIFHSNIYIIKLSCAATVISYYYDFAKGSFTRETRPRGAKRKH